MAAVRDRVDQVTRSPVFVNSSGRRRRWVTWALGAVAVVCTGYLLLLGFSLTGGPLTPQDLLPLVDPPGTSQPQRVESGDRAPADEARTPAPGTGTATAGTPATAGTGAGTGPAGASPSGVPGQPTGSAAAPSAGEPPASEPAASEPAASEPAEDPPVVTLPPLPTPSVALPSASISVGVGGGG